MSDEINMDNELNEFQIYWKQWPLRIFGSFEEMNEYEYKRRAETSGIQHLANMTFMIEQQYANELKRSIDKQIHFRMINGVKVE